MSSDHDASEFIDGDFQARKSPYSSPASGAGPAHRAPTREEVDSKVVEAQQKLAELKHAQEELERERSALEETRRRQMEFHAGREEMVQHLTRGLGLLQEAEFSARHDAEQMAKTLAGLREGLAKVEAIHEESWSKDNFSVELTRALTALENARMEWNAARLKFPVLASSPSENAANGPGTAAPVMLPFGSYSFLELCRVGFALTWPVMAGLLALLLALLLRH